MSLKPPANPNSPLGDGRVFWNAVTDGGALAGVATSQHTAIQRTINSAHAAGGGTVFVPDGTYTLTSGLTGYSDITLELSPGAVLDFSTAAVSTTLLSFTGTEAATVALTGNTTVGGTSLSVAAGAESGFTAGDYVRVGSTAIWDPGRTNNPLGEIAVVLSTASGTINLRSPLVGGAYNTADSAVVSKITPLRRCGVRGGKILGGGSGSQHAGIVFDMVVHGSVVGTHFDAVEYVALAAYDSIDVVFDGVNVERSNLAGTGYGVMFVYACAGCKVVNSHFRDCRHGTTSGGGTSRKGFPRRCLYANNTIVDTTDVGMDIHANAEDMTITGNTIYDAGNMGINVNCPSATITNNTIVRSASDGIQIRNFSDAPTQYTVTGNRIIAPGSGGIEWLSSGTSHGTTNYGAVISDNYIQDSVAQSIVVSVTSPDAFRLSGAVVKGNVIRNPGSQAIRFVTVDNSVIADNVCHDVPNTLTGIFLNDVNDATVTGNVVEYVSLNSGTAFLVSPGTGVVLTGNRAKNAWTGINVSAASSGCTIANNDMTGATNTYTLSTGTGHVIQNNTPGVVPTTTAAATTTLPRYATVHTISGNTGITSITADTAGRVVTLIFSGTPTVTDGSNLKLAGNFVAAGTTNDVDTLTLVSDGTNWIEIARSAN